MSYFDEKQGFSPVVFSIPHAGLLFPFHSDWSDRIRRIAELHVDRI